MRRIDPGDLRRLPPSRILLLGPPPLHTVLEGPPPELALPVWLLLSDLQLLATRNVEQGGGPVVRGSALAHGSPADAELREPLRLLDAAVREGRTVGTEVGVTVALGRIVAVFRERGWEMAAMTVAESWLWVQPESSAANLVAGSLAGDAGRLGEAETLSARSLIIARQAEDWAAYCEAGLALGEAHRRRGASAAARRILAKVQKRGRRQGLKEAAAAAAHGLFTLAAEAGDLEVGRARAEEALHEYPPGHERRALLTRQLAQLSTERGDHRGALRLLSGIGEAAGAPVERALRAASACRAAALVEDRERFEWFWASAWRWSYDESARAAWTPCLMELARAAHAMGDGERARMAAARAVEPAREGGDEESVLALRDLLDPVR